jgi:uncharacterized protein (DUF2249 family)
MNDTASDATVRPPFLAGIPETSVVIADVRDELRAGREPFSIIMAARATVPAGGALCVRAIFEPAPLYRVLGKQGLAHWTESRAADDWIVWFYEEADAVPAVDAGEPGTAAEDDAGADDVVVLDVRGLEPPEPMVRTLEALEQLPQGATLVQLNVRVPQFLLPKLEERGFTWEIREQDEDLVRLFIRRVEDTARHEELKR